MDPSVQVALISVGATAVTSVGVVLVAVVNNYKKPTAEVKDDIVDEGDVLVRILSMIAENERKEKQITLLKIENRGLRAENDILRRELEQLKASNDVQ